MGRGEKRKWIRVRQRITVTYWTGETSLTTAMQDLGEGGMFLDASHSLDKGTTIDFSFPLPGPAGAVLVRGRGRVTWTEELMGAGVEFVEIEEESRELIRRYVAGEPAEDERSVELEDPPVD